MWKDLPDGNWVNGGTFEKIIIALIALSLALSQDTVGRRKQKSTTRTICWQVSDPTRLGKTQTTSPVLDFYLPIFVLPFFLLKKKKRFFIFFQIFFTLIFIERFVFNLFIVDLIIHTVAVY